MHRWHGNFLKRYLQKAPHAKLAWKSTETFRRELTKTGAFLRLSLNVDELFKPFVRHRRPISAHLPSTAHTEPRTHRSAATQLAGMVRATPRLSSSNIPLTGKKIPHEHAVFLSLAVTSQPGVRVFMRMWLFPAESTGTERTDSCWSSRLLSLSPRCLSHVPLQSGESTRRSVNQSPARFHLTHAECPMVRCFPPRLRGAAVKQRHLPVTWQYWHNAGTLVPFLFHQKYFIFWKCYFLIYKRRLSHMEAWIDTPPPTPTPTNGFISEIFSGAGAMTIHNT